MADTLFTRAGTPVDLQFVRQYRHPDRDAKVLLYDATTRGENPQRFAVLLLAPPLLDMALRQTQHGSLEEVQEKLGLAAVLDAVDRRSELPLSPNGIPEVEVDVDEALGFFERTRPTDRELRRLIARRCYDSYASGTLESDTNIDATDFFITGARHIDFARNVGLLAAEGYLTIKRNDPDVGILLRGTAKLVREVEKYGAPREDASSDRDYAALLSRYPVLSNVRQNVLAEYDRYAVALTAAELESVFRATAPIVESVAREVLQANGCNRTLDTLGPMIQELKNRGLVGNGTITELRYVVKFARDLEQHGTTLPESVLRIACETLFDVLPQLAAAAPRAA